MKAKLVYLYIIIGLAGSGFVLYTLNVVQAPAVRRDVTYSTTGGVPLKMDLYFPQGHHTKLMPAVVYVHGGAWMGGDKNDQAVRYFAPTFVDRGYIVASVNYRLAPKYKFPAQIEDVKCAIRYLRANARRYHVDPDRIGVVGASAGGHLVSLLGLAGPKAGFEGHGGYYKESSSVQAVVDMFGPADLTVENFDLTKTDLGRKVFGAASLNSPILKKASPVTYVHKSSPPFLILQGDKDEVVPPSQSRELYTRLRAAGVPATLVIVKNAGHGFQPVGGPIDPMMEDIGNTIGDFFDRNLRER